MFLHLDFLQILKILILNKIKDKNILWQIIRDWFKFDTDNRQTYFKILFKECFQLEHLPLYFVKKTFL